MFELVGEMTLIIALAIGYFVSDDGVIPTAIALFWSLIIAIGIWMLLLLFLAFSNGDENPQETGTFNSAMTGLDYEVWVSERLQHLGWKTRVTQGSGDQGVDVVAEKGGTVVAIQCKKYSSPVGNKAVQEAFSGKTYIGANKAAVVTNASFTRSAYELAQSVGVQLLHHDELSRLSA